MYLRQVLRGHFGTIDPSIDLLFEFIEATAQRTRKSRGGRQHEPDSGAQNSGIGSRAKQSDPQAKVGKAVAVGLGNPFNQAVESEPPQLVGHPALSEMVERQAA
jgi:hypothetical protein